MITLIGACAAGSATAFAQATMGNIFGKAPAGDTVSAQSTTSGLLRRGQVDAKGRYYIGPLPVGNYTVTLEENGRPIVKHLNVPVVVDRGIKVDFHCIQNCAPLASKP
ncbi:Oar protein [Rhodanobacter thiooxydans]|uniref:Oar protein n=2 Tax=Rhodanobacter thiooxydans TaxID=416169 RepID=A0A154QFS4_9GAMM|nr:carboxypeptidase-like regulatory domain-containing protein [Rhodanobacter thiooxydans]EIL99212.1 TonB-dependent receptor [Rhodanobacter thiooxydans LCS2]KZC22630.1 Oar protein [Rhodanobacter thiooxydans]